MKNDDSNFIIRRNYKNKMWAEPYEGGAKGEMVPGRLSLAKVRGSLYLGLICREGARKKFGPGALHCLTRL